MVDGEDMEDMEEDGEEDGGNIDPYEDCNIH
jgi:hypothetical protein